MRKTLCIAALCFVPLTGAFEVDWGELFILNGWYSGDLTSTCGNGGRMTGFRKQ